MDNAVHIPEMESNSASGQIIQKGMQVEHQRFGTGEVLQIEGTNANKKAVVHFDGIGEKQLLLKYARLKILNQ
jgi:DNA helicase-2/ATP-dependent DNA helicase PcrA